MSRKKTPRSKGASAPAASAPPAANGSRPARPIGPPPPARPSLGGGDFYNVAFKIMLVGDSGVGKTCLLVRFKDGAFLAGTFISTVGIDFRNKVLDVDGVKVKLQTPGCACRCRSGTQLARSGSAVLPTPTTATPMAWLTEIHEYAQHNVALMLLGNKVDSTQERVVKREDGEKLAKEYGLPFMETSAKTGLNVDLAFTAIAKELKQRSMKAPSEPRFRLHDYVKREGQGTSCCRP
ncbi:ras-related protein Rab-26 isoform X2 [Vulpes lagopus]|uniref:ras-related protein Rab-26 isoform X2 n=1 Tax=Vulpes lagopus TaxID=494514 RepID=UPI001BC9B3B9|nr:ras-related protein Rab-26 isoform X2 [Vulpes lagopus]